MIKVDIRIKRWFIVIHLYSLPLKLRLFIKKSKINNIYLFNDL